MDKYEILGQVGEGSFGQVYRARKRSVGEIVAFKVIRKVKVPDHFRWSVFKNRPSPSHVFQFFPSNQLPVTVARAFPERTEEFETGMRDSKTSSSSQYRANARLV